MKTLKTVIAFIILNSTFTISSNAQIVYTDVNPDSTSSYGTPYYLDLNNDGINDFELYISHTSVVTHCTSCGNTNTYNSKTLILPLGSNSIGLNGVNSKLGLNTLIDSNALTWSNTSVTLISSSHSTSGSCYFGACIPSTTISGNWASGGTNKYLGLKINVGSQLYFGWIQLTVNSTSSFTAKDYAFTTVANQSILAGQTCSPQAAIIANGPLSFCSGGSVVLTSKNAGNTLKYQWKKNNVNISGATNKSYTATTAGDYKVKVTDTLNNCYKTSGIKTVTVPCRISNDNVVETLEHLSVYPNPATNSVTIKFPSEEAGEIQIVNLFGQIVFSEKVNAEQKTIDVSRFSAGMYMVRWSSGENNETKTFSVIK